MRPELSTSPGAETSGDRPAWEGLELRESRLFYGVSAALTGSVATAAALLGLGPFSPLFFGGAASWSLLRCARPRVRARVTAEGLSIERALGARQLVRWSEIADVRPARRAAVQVVLADEAAFREGQPFWRRFGSTQPTTAGLGPIVFNAWALSGSRSAIVAALQKALDARTISSVGSTPLASPTSSEGGRALEAERPDQGC